MMTCEWLARVSISCVLSEVDGSSATGTFGEGEGQGEGKGEGKG